VTEADRGASPGEEEVPQEMSFVDHLIELRGRLLRSVVGFLLVFLCLFPFAQELYTWLAQPLLGKMPAGTSMIATGVVTPFFVPLKVTGLAALLVALPWVLYQAWAFVAPGLYAHEKRWVGPLVVASTLLFFAGMAFAYYAVLPMVFGFITGFAPEGVAVMTDIAAYFDFVLGLFIAFGVTFEVPVLVVVLIAAGIVTPAKLREWRPYVIVGAFVIGAIFTPPDVISQLMMAIPLWILFEIGVLVGARFEPASD
jgi:sec-independent protein translocase protein TatC